VTATTKVPLGASTLNRKWYLDVNTGSVAVPVWVGVFGMLDFQPVLNPTLQDDSDFDSGGYKSSTVTALDWSATFKVSRKVQASAITQYDPGQEFLRLTSLTQGVLNSVQVRFYEMSPGGPRIEAFSGLAAVSWSPDGGAMDALDTVSVTLTGQGQRTSISHPDTVTPVPAVVSLSPTTAAAAGGATVTIHGSGFTGATAVHVGATLVATTSWTLVNDGTIVMSAPAKSAAAYDVDVTTPGGTSSHVAGDMLTYS
jgi:hypothetical protein